MSSMFLSHNHADKPFARQLDQSLKLHGIRTWVDECEMKVGDSLIQKISDGIQQCEFLGVVLSPKSVHSEWVKREVNIALTEEIRGRKVKGLPILYQECQIPAFLHDKVYADFTYSFDAGLVSLLRTLGKDVTGLLSRSENSGPFILEFSETDWLDEPGQGSGYSISIPFSKHGKRAPIPSVQKRTETGWQVLSCDIRPSDIGDLKIVAGARYIGRVVV